MKIRCWQKYVPSEGRIACNSALINPKVDRTTRNITDPSAFRSGRECAACIGLVPRQNSTGGKERLGGISKQGDRYLRRLLGIGCRERASSASEDFQERAKKRAILASTVARSRPNRTRLFVINRCDRLLICFGGGSMSRNVASVGVSSTRARAQA